jgi:HK97 gp10 family phage protein
MADGVTFKVEGLMQLGQALRAMAGDGAVRASRSMASAMARIVRTAAKANLQRRGLRRRTGTLEKNIINHRARKTNLTAQYDVLVRTKQRRYGNTQRNRRLGRVGGKYTVEGDAFYWKFHEYGAPGRNIPARPFMRPAIDENKQRAIVEARKAGARAIRAAARRAVRR